MVVKTMNACEIGKVGSLISFPGGLGTGNEPKTAEVVKCGGTIMRITCI